MFYRRHTYEDLKYLFTYWFCFLCFCFVWRIKQNSHWRSIIIFILARSNCPYKSNEKSYCHDEAQKDLIWLPAFMACTTSEINSISLQEQPHGSNRTADSLPISICFHLERSISQPTHVMPYDKPDRLASNCTTWGLILRSRMINQPRDRRCCGGWRCKWTRYVELTLILRRERSPRSLPWSTAPGRSSTGWAAYWNRSECSPQCTTWVLVAPTNWRRKLMARTT